MSSSNMEFFNEYIEEFRDHLLVFNESLMYVEKSENKSELINTLFRIAHSIKGNSASMEFFNIEKITHKLEDIFDEIREGRLSFTSEIISSLYACHDLLEDYVEIIENDKNDENIDTSKFNDLLQSIWNTSSNLENNCSNSSPIQNDNDNNSNPISLLKSTFFKPLNNTLQKMDECIKNNETLFFISILIDKNCLMKSISCWLVLESLDTNASIIYSNPMKPSEESFVNGSFCFDGESILAIVKTNKCANELSQIISSVQDISKLNIYEITLDNIDPIKNKLVLISLMDKLIVDFLGDKVSINSSNFSESIIEEIKTIKSLQDSKSIVFSCLTTLEGAILYVNNSSVYIDEQDIEYIIRALGYIKEIIINPEYCDSLIGMLNENLDHISDIKNRVKHYLGEILVSMEKIKACDVEEIVTKQKSNERFKDLKFGQIAILENKVTANDINEAVKLQKKTIISDKDNSNKQNTSDNDFMRISSAKIDNLVDMLGELIIYNSQIEQILSTSVKDNKIVNLMSRMNGIVKNVQELSKSLKMVEIKPILHRITRIARDTAKELDKKINVQIQGEETQIDKNAADKLVTPLMHIVRNAVSHGIETEDIRLKKSKPNEGHIEISAYNKRNNVYIEVSDDGKGIDTKKILAKAIEKNLADQNVTYSDDEIIKMIFLPGFSTQEQVNNISGRGVGMNIVEDEINHLGGKIEVINRGDNGSSFILKIPMNLAVLNGTVIEIDSNKFIIPTLYIKEFYVIHEGDWIKIQGKTSAIKVRNQIIPLMPILKILNIKSKNLNEYKQIIILEVDGKLFALPVDNIISRQEIVAKPLSNELANLDYASGASILGDGKVSLILDIEALYKISEKIND